MTSHTTPPVALITGSSQRIGAAVVRTLHAAGYNIVIHYRHSSLEASALADALNTERKDSAIIAQADLADLTQLQPLAKTAAAKWGRFDALVNNASSFFPTPIGSTTEAQWDDLIASNMKAPFFLAQALATALIESRGSIINIADIHGEKPLKNHTVYCMAKAANRMLTESLALELAPAVRVNGIAPGAILWPTQGGATSEAAQRQLLEKIPLQRMGNAEDIARAVLFLLRDAPYISGQILTIDGGRSITR